MARALRPSINLRQISRGRNAKILGARAQGAASTQDSGTRRTITRGTVLEGGNFAGKSLVGVSFQQVAPAATVRPSGPARQLRLSAGLRGADS